MNVSLNKLLQWLIIGLLFPVTFLNGWLALRVLQHLQPLITVFVVATLLAFILNYPVQVLQKRGVKRNYATILVFLPSLVILIALGITLIPLLIEEFNEITKLIPHWINSGNQQLKTLQNWAVSQGLPVNLNNLATQLTDSLPNEVEDVADKLLSLALDTVNSLSEVVLIVVLTFYLLLDGRRLWDGIFQKLPSSFGLQVEHSLQQNFQNYFIGQIALGSLVGFSMTLMFLVLKVPFGLFFGLGVGIASLVPFGDVLSLGMIILLIASHNFGLGVKVLAAAIVIDQVIDQAIAPRLLGSFTGLRPVWVLVSLVLGTKVGGLLGLLVAVPLASSIKSVADGLQVNTSNYSNDAANATTDQTSGQNQGSSGILTKEPTS